MVLLPDRAKWRGIGPCVFETASCGLVCLPGFSFAHMLCSMRVVDLARRRYSQGTVMGFNVRAWEVRQP